MEGKNKIRETLDMLNSGDYKELENISLCTAILNETIEAIKSTKKLDTDLLDDLKFIVNDYLDNNFHTDL